jgi:hypothetical protein
VDKRQPRFSIVKYVPVDKTGCNNSLHHNRQLSPYHSARVSVAVAQLPYSFWLTGWHCKMHTRAAPQFPYCLPAASIASWGATRDISAILCNTIASLPCSQETSTGPILSHTHRISSEIHLMIYFRLLLGFPSGICPTWGSSSCSATVEMSAISYNSEVHCRTHKSPSRGPILNHFSEIQFNTIFPPTSRFS